MKEKQAFDNYNPVLFPRLERAAEVIGGAIKFVVSPLKTELCLSEHKRGGAELLDKALDYQPELPFEAAPDVNTWDDMGCYYERD